MVYKFDSGVLFIIESSGKQIAVDKDIDPLRLEIPEIIEFQCLTGCRIRNRSRE
jgi:hypothetical protein